MGFFSSYRNENPTSCKEQEKSKLFEESHQARRRESWGLGI
jgi:hypothetical protein